MKDKEKALDKLKTIEQIISDHSEAFTPEEAYEIGRSLRFLLAYIDNENEGGTIYCG